MADAAKDQGKNNKNGDGRGCGTAVGLVLTAIGLVLTYVYALDQPDLYLTKATAVRLLGHVVYVNLTFENRGKAGARNIRAGGVEEDNKDGQELAESADDTPSNGTTMVPIIITRTQPKGFGYRRYRVHLQYDHTFGFRPSHHTFCIETQDKQLDTPFTTATPDININIDMNICHE